MLSGDTGARKEVFLSTPSARRATEHKREYMDQNRISIHALREEGDPDDQAVGLAPFQFLSTPSARRATRRHPPRRPQKQNFYPRPPRGGRPLTSHPSWCEKGYFYPRPPRGGRLLSGDTGARKEVFLSTPSARRATAFPGLLRVQRLISIHALREEGDRRSAGHTTRHLDFYPRPPRGGRPERLRSERQFWAFLSTPSARRATSCSSFPSKYIAHFYPRPPRGGRLPTLTRTTPPLSHFYPRPPRGGRHHRHRLHRG